MAAIALMSVAASCKGHIVEDSSAFAAVVGDSTMALGGCQKPMELGYSGCQLTKDAPIPSLDLFFMNPASYAVSDCRLNIYKSGSVNSAQWVQIDLSGLKSQIDDTGFCLLKIESIEKYPDPRDPNQLREIPVSGGFFIEILPSDYFPEPSDQDISWCYRLSGTNKGRRKIEPCK